MDFSLVNIPSGLVEHANITKITLKLFPLMLCMTQHHVVSYCITIFVILVFNTGSMRTEHILVLFCRSHFYKKLVGKSLKTCPVQ